jgi:hypothetical protein
MPISRFGLDQHAADERVRLEALQNVPVTLAFLDNTSMSVTHSEVRCSASATVADS